MCGSKAEGFLAFVFVFSSMLTFLAVTCFCSLSKFVVVIGAVLLCIREAILSWGSAMVLVQVTLGSGSRWVFALV